MSRMSLALCITLILQFWIALASRTDLTARWNTGFVTVSGGRFSLNGSLWRFYGTNAYWLQMSTNDDIDLTFRTIATAGFRVVRTWAFNDVSCKPSPGTYFQILQNGQATINTGANGLQRLDQVVAAAQKYGVKLLLTLTNNWNPERPAPTTSWDRRGVADNGKISQRGFLSNDYGGIDLYVRNFKPGGTHDLFYTDSTIISAFKNYVAQVVKRYADNPTVLGWELGNDLRCSSTVPASSSCNTQTITKWVFEISNYIKTIDSNHLVTAGDGGFYCLGCKKLYAKNSTQPNAVIFPGPSFDGSYGVDTEDILASPCIDFGSFQLFPDQVNYFPDQVESFATKAIGDGGKWVGAHSNTAKQQGKPEVLTAMELVTKDFWQFFVPFNATCPFPDTIPCRGVEEFQQTYAFTSWAGTSLNGDVDGVLEYLWVQHGLTSHGTTFGPNSKRALTDSPPGGGNYNGAASGQSAQQFIHSQPPLPS